MKKRYVLILGLIVFSVLNGVGVHLYKKEKIAVLEQKIKDNNASIGIYQSENEFYQNMIKEQYKDVVFYHELLMDKSLKTSKDIKKKQKGQ